MTILNKKPIDAFRKKKTGDRYKYFQEYHGVKSSTFEKEKKITGILIGKETHKYFETIKCLERISKNNIITLPTRDIALLNGTLEGVKKGWCFIMLVGETIDDITAIAIQHYIKTIDYDAWNIYVKKKEQRRTGIIRKKTFSLQTRLFKYYANFENGYIRNVLCIGTALQGTIERIDGRHSS